MVIVRPSLAVVHRAASGQARQAAPNRAAPACRPAAGRTGTVTPAGQVTVLPSRSIAKRSLGKRPFTAAGGWHLMPL